MYVIFSMYLLKTAEKDFLKRSKSLVFGTKNAQNLYLSISKFSRDSRCKIPWSPGLKKGRESREFPSPGIPGAELYLGGALKETYQTMEKFTKN